ncbi:Envelope glycoprotein [Podochytrium sp. JEL0797]|nr:Envelope glycoprotein [Podochytrium sp. JEL0797]
MLKAFQSLNLRPDPRQLRAINSLEALSCLLVASRQTPPERPLASIKTSRYLVGSVGSGKTVLMDTFHADVNSRCHQRQLPAISKRVHFLEFMASIHYPFLLLSQSIASKSPVLCLDEFQLLDIGESMVLRRLFTSLFALNQDTHARQLQPAFSLVATSNKRISELYQTGLNRELVKPLLKLLDTNCETIDMSSTDDGDAMDYRRSGSQRDESRVFYYPPSNMMRVAFLQSFEKACKGVPAYNLTALLPHGRRIPAFGSFEQRVLLVPFETLCGAEGKLGGADYVALCRSFDHIFIQGPVPLLDADSVNFKGTRSIDLGRRFINFIDVAYDSRVHFCVETEAGVEDMLQGLRSKEDGRLFAVGVMETQVKKEGGSSSSGATTYVGMMEWSATGLQDHSLAKIGGIGATETGFAVERAISRVIEMGSDSWRKRGSLYQ